MLSVDALRFIHPTYASHSRGFPTPAWRLDIHNFKYIHKVRYFYEFVGAGFKPARYGNGPVMKNDGTKNERVRAGFKPAPTEKISKLQAGVFQPRRPRFQGMDRNLPILKSTTLKVT
jgi:hypothetical protein